MLVNWSQVIKIGMCLASTLQLTGCTQLQMYHKDTFSIQASQLVTPPAHIARLILIRSRENLLPFPEKNPVALYNGSEKIADIPHGKFLKLDSPKLPQHFTVHWFDTTNPKISRTINLKINLQPGEMQTVELSMSKERLVAQLIDVDATTNKLHWYAEISTPDDFSASYVSLEADSETVIHQHSKDIFGRD